MVAETSCTSEYLFAHETIGSEPRFRYLSVMITRLLLSLKKANSSQERAAWSLGELTTHTTMRFAERRGGVTTRDEMVPLDTFVDTREGTQSQA